MSFSLKAPADGMRRRPVLSACLRFLLAAGTVAVCFLMLEASLTTRLSHLAAMHLRVILLNLGTIGVFLAGLLLLCRRVWLSCAVTAAVSGATAIINHYVIFLHGQPLSFLMLKNFRTALNVLGSYTLPVHNSVIVTVAAMLFVLLCCLLVRRCAAELSGRWARIRGAAAVVYSLCVLYFGYFSAEPIKPRQTITWLWTPAYTQYGYAACTLETLQQSVRAVRKPEGCTDAALEIAADAALQAAAAQNAAETAGPAPGMLPDVVLILNETFYDLRLLADIRTDAPFLGHIESMEDLLTGYAVVPSAGGGTNSSEYELLTGNSLQLLPGVTPFNVLDLNDAAGIVSVLAQQGYTTVGCHPEAPENYNRRYGYSALGFDRAYFTEDFLEKEWPEGRNFPSDASIYRDALRWYEECPADRPRFLYCLTIQNHGAWENGPSEHDTVHVLDDYGDHTDDVNEFLTSIARTDEAFYSLTEYFAARERPVILCMVGDHSPSIDRFIADPTLGEEELALLRRTVPLLVWANFPLPETTLGTVSLNYVAPTLLELAGVRMPPYYSYMTQLRAQVPVLTAIGKYVTADGTVHDYSETTPLTAAINDYFYLEYNNLSRQPRQELFRITPD